VPEKLPDGAATADRAGPPASGAVAVGFNVPGDPENPFSELAVARKPPVLPTPLEPAAEAVPGADSAGPPADPPLPDRSELMAEIEREAESRKAELQKQQELKEHAREVVDAESLRRLEEDRVAFRRELAEILRAGGKEAGQKIDDLCNRYGRNYDPVTRARVTYLLRHTPGRVSRETRVRQFRSYGVPEPGILDYLANELHHLINTRNGPRHPDDVRVSAARQLLRIKLTQDLRAPSTELQARSVPPGPTDPPGNPSVR
jgi:hypothetical protein